PIRGSAATAPPPSTRIELTGPAHPLSMGRAGVFQCGCRKSASRRKPGPGKLLGSRYPGRVAAMPVVEFGRAEKWVPAFAGTTVKGVTRLFSFGALALILLLGAATARAEDFGATVAGLGGASFAEKERA